MTTSGQRGSLGFAIATATFGDATIATSNNNDTTQFNVDADGWWTQPFTGASLAVNEFSDVLKPEIGKTLFVKGAYKNGAFMGGSATMDIRLANRFGKILQAMGGLTGATSAARGSEADSTKNTTAAFSDTTGTVLQIETGSGLVPGDVIKIESEYMLVVAAMSGDLIFSVVRGWFDPATGAVSTAATHITASDVYYTKRNKVTRFSPDLANEVFSPVIHARRYVPGSAGNDGFTEYALDGKAMALAMTLPQMGPASAEFSAAFRRPVTGDREFTMGYGAVATAVNASSTLTWTNPATAPAVGSQVFFEAPLATGFLANTPYFVLSNPAANTATVGLTKTGPAITAGSGAAMVARLVYEYGPTAGLADSAQSLAVSCSSNVHFPGLGVSTLAGASNVSFMGAQVVLANGTISPQDSMVIGSYHPQDFTILSRSASIRLAYKWQDEALYKKIVYGNAFGSWSPTVVYSDVVLSIKAAGNAPTGGKPYELVLFFPSVALAMSAPTLLPGRFITTELSGVVTNDGLDRGAPWAAFLYNDTTYT